MLFYLMKSAFGPKLYRIYNKPGQQTGRNYEMNNLEYFSNTFISIFHGFCSLCKWTSPLIFAYAYSRGYLTLNTLLALSRLALVFGSCLFTAYMSRGFGRYTNPDYKLFITKLNDSKTNEKERKEFLTTFDFELKHWQADFIASNKHPLFKENSTHRLIHSSITDTLKFNIWYLLSHLCVNTFGLRMMFPGVLLHNLISKALNEGRSKFIEHKRAVRAVIQTSCNYRNKIDTLFIDQRNRVRYSDRNIATLDNLDTNSNNGNTLFICCDGNASFYEVGCFQVPIERGFSVLGWNYPGFAQSTGMPYPVQLTAAADAVMQYAFKLGFKPENIVLFSWSIGGFAVSWLTKHYPDVRGVVLDACFDSITPLAQQSMPKFATTFVDFTIRHQLNLNVAEQLKDYQGSILYIRRTQDEIISTIQRVASTNRGNDLLIATLNSRYPFIVNDDTIPYIRTWLSAKSEVDRARIQSSYSSDIDKCVAILRDYVQLQPKPLRYPLNLGDEADRTLNEKCFLSKDLKLTMAMYLAGRYMLNFESSHCQGLPSEFCQLPWSETQL